MKKIFILSACFFLSFSALHSQELISTQELLLSYLENDIELQKLTLSAQKAQLSEESVKIDNGFDVSLSSGTVTIKSDKTGTKISAKPKAEIDVFPAGNLALKGETNLTQTSNEKNSNETKISDTTISASIDIISDKNSSRKVSLMKAGRSRIEAERAVQSRAVSAEKEFYTELKNLLNSINSIIKSQSTLYSDTINFEQTKAKGYSTSSSTYRLAQMKVVSDTHSVNSGIKDFINDYIVFYKKCGYDIEISDDIDFMTLIPSDIQDAEPLNAENFNKDNYTKLESANWNHTINSIERKSKRNFSLSANGGYTIDNSTTKSDTVNAGLSSTYQGLTLGAGIELPVGVKDSNPVFSVSASISLNSFRKASITTKTNKLTEEQELLDIQSAETSYITYLITAKQNLEQILWEQNTTLESYEMYEGLEKDLAAWYKNGVISESEYLSAKTNYNQYKVQTIINKINLLIYNNEVKSNFVQK
ncbi:MAG: TolC family protein [Treponema sp.]|nr:TolC family protein [Treponema sp.]